ncbi:MAG: WG repeat-containing protein [Leptospiraceae bacterium]|nr:WG repeat-containing protein [Leptospiraceae bacterium]
MKYLILFFLVITIGIVGKEKVTKYHEEVFGNVEYNQYGIGFIVTKEGKWFAINKKGKLLHEVFTYDNGADYVAEGLIRFVHNGKMGFINEKAKIVIPARFDFVEPFENGKANFCNGCETEQVGEHKMFKKGTGTWGTINKQGMILK